MTTVAGNQVGGTVAWIGDALDRWAPEERPQFESELREALLAAAEDLDLTRVERTVTLWRTRAAMLAHPLTAQERAQLQRVRAGDSSGLRHRSEDGTWTTL